MAGREVIHLQFGSFANYVGAHYWNFQDELLGLQEREDTRATANQIDLNTVYRAGETLQGEPTYTPRLVLFDLKGSLGGVGARGTLYLDEDLSAAQAGISTWSGRAEVHRSEPVPKSSFMQQLEGEGDEEEEEGTGTRSTVDEALPSVLDMAARQLDSAGGVRYFSDFLKAHLHPRSLCQLEGAWAGATEFGGWGDGAGHGGGGEERREEFMEAIRFFAEECDSLQGFQCLAEDLSGFGQLAADVLQDVRDDYSGRPVMLFGVRPTAAAPDPALSPADARRHRLNDALSHAVLAQRCDSYSALATPASHAALPALRWQDGNRYHASAILAAAVDSATLPFRLATGQGSAGATGGMDMGTLAQLLGSRHATSLAALSLALPCPLPLADLQQEQQRVDARVEQRPGDKGPGGQKAQGQPFTSNMTACLTPGLHFSTAMGGAYVESVVLRGARSGEGAPLPLGTAGAALDGALVREAVRCVRQRLLVAQPLPIPLPYPHIFGPGLSTFGVPGRMPRPSTAAVASCPVLTRLAGTEAFGPAMRGLQREFERAAGAAQGQATLEGWGYGREEVAEVCERLANLAATYDLGCDDL